MRQGPAVAGAWAVDWSQGGSMLGEYLGSHASGMELGLTWAIRCRAIVSKARAALELWLGLWLG